MKTAALLALAALLAPIAFIIAHSTHRWAWPSALSAALIFAGLILGAHVGMNW